MGPFLSYSTSGSVYSSRVFVMHGRDYFLVPKCSPMMDSLSMRSGTFFGQGSPCGR